VSISINFLLWHVDKEVGEHVTLPTYFHYTFNIAVGLNDSADLDELYGLALRSAPPRHTLKLCNGMSAFCTAKWRRCLEKKGANGESISFFPKFCAVKKLSEKSFFFLSQTSRPFWPNKNLILASKIVILSTQFFFVGDLKLCKKCEQCLLKNATYCFAYVFNTRRHCRSEEACDWKCKYEKCKHRWMKNANENASMNLQRCKSASTENANSYILFSFLHFSYLHFSASHWVHFFTAWALLGGIDSTFVALAKFIYSHIFS